MSHMIRIPFVAACLFAAVPAAAQDWALDIQPAQCTLTRAVTGPEPMLVSLWTLPGSGKTTMIVASRNVPDAGTRPFPIAMQFAEGTPAIAGTGGAFPVRKEAGHGIAIKELGPEFLDGFAKSSTITFIVAGKSHGPFAYPKAGGAIRAFRKCAADQLIEWGADPAQFAAGGKTPVPLEPTKTWLTIGQVGDLGGRNASFSATFRLSVSPDGTVDGCAVIDEPADKRAERIGCGALMHRKLFTPAQDAAGKAVRGVYAWEFGVVRLPNRGQR